ncbi:MAG TPA: hypothetical protein VF690_16370 [Hymenobacter sp.]|jgi:hypothetical protein
MAGPHPGFSQGRDTVFAVRKLFREKRTAGEGLLTAGADIASGTQYAQRPEGRPTAQEARGDGLVSAAFTGVGMAKQTRYSTENEAYILRLYAEGQPIPPDIRRKLRRKHFHRSAKDILLN